jgi:hypothetical protein
MTYLANNSCTIKHYWRLLLWSVYHVTSIEHDWSWTRTNFSLWSNLWVLWYHRKSFNISAMPPGMLVSLCYSLSSFAYLLCMSQSVDVFPNAFQHISNDVSQILVVRLINLNLRIRVPLEMIHIICSIQT